MSETGTVAVRIHVAEARTRETRQNLGRTPCQSILQY